MPELLRLHHLGHSSFALRFADGVSVLTDYGKSNAFGLGGPIYDLGDLQPDVVLYSHHDDDHDRGDEFPGATILDGAHLHEEVGIDGIVFEPIKTSEHAPGDNTSFLIEEPGGPDYAIESAARSDNLIKVIDLEPGPWPPDVS
jgi:hypothetical protein